MAHDKESNSGVYKMMKMLTGLFALVLLSACQSNPHVSKLPNAVSNNAVALINAENGLELYSFFGISQGKTWQDIQNTGYRYSQNSWSSIKMPLNSKPVLAATAVSIDDQVYLIGGYTVAEDQSEKSVAEIYKLDTATLRWSIATKMPIPVDDTVALVYANRYIYLLSGWHDDDNVSRVQVYDIKDNTWFNATNYPLPAVFGHAGGIVDNVIIVCDGVKVVHKEKSRDFVSSQVCAKGTINPLSPDEIKWQQIPHHGQKAYYRMASTGYKKGKKIVFAGGSDNPYNFNGIGYNNEPSMASNQVFYYDLLINKWLHQKNSIPANMDHRALLNFNDIFYIIGGMENNQKVSDKIVQFKLAQ